MANLRFIVRNLIPSATVSASTAQVSTTLDEQNLKRATERGRVCRSTGLASQVITSVFASGTLNAIAFTRHNWTTAATLRNVITGTPGHDTTALTAFATTGLDTVIEDYTSRDFRHLKNSIQYFATQTGATQIVSTIADAANPDGYIEQTKMFAGKYLEVAYNPPQGNVTLTQMDASTGERADDGTHIVDKSYKARRLQIDLDYVDDAVDLASLLAMARYLGRDGEGFVDLYPESATAKGLYNRMAFRLVDSPTFNPHQYGHHKNTLVLEET